MDSNSQASQFFYSRFGQEEGLNCDSITSLVQDSYGYLWVGTSRGLFRFDGQSFVEFEFDSDESNRTVFDLLIGVDGKLWIAGKNGVTSFDGSNYGFFGVQHITEGSFCNSLVTTPEGDVYFIYDKKFIYLIRDKVIEPVDLPEDISLKVGGLFIAEFNKLHVVAKDLILNINSKGKVGIDTAWQLIKRPVDVGFLFSDSGLYTPGLSGSFLINEAEKKICMVDENAIFLKEGRDNNAWWVGERSGLIKVYKEDTTCYDLTYRYRLDSLVINKLFFDLEKNIWIGTNSGLFRFTGGLLRYVAGSEQINDTPTSIWANEDGEIDASYFGTGIVHFNNGIKRISPYIKEIGTKYIRQIVKRNDTTWVLSTKGVMEITNGIITHFNTGNGLPNNYTFYGLHDKQSILIATEGGLGIIQKNKIKSVTTDQGLINNRIKYIYSESDGTYLLLEEGAIQKYVGEKISPFIVEGFKNKEILNTVFYDGNQGYWIGSDINGLIYFNKEFKKLIYLNENNALPFSRVRTIHKYKESSILIGTEMGIYRIDIESNNHFNIKPIGTNLGFPDFEVALNSCFATDSLIYYGTNLGIVVLDLSKIPSETAPDLIHITGLDIAFKPTDWSGSHLDLNTWFNYPVSPVLAYDQNDFMLRFKSISQTTANPLWYRFKLVNYDQEWSMPTQQDHALYANLNPGKYLFYVNSSKDGINWGNNTALYTILIAPPFWKTWWFYLIVIALMLVVFVLINNFRIKYKINQLIAIEKLNKEEYSKIQKKVAMDFHDEVGNHLTSISMIVQLIQEKKRQVPDTFLPLLSKLDDESKNLFQGTKDFIWSIDPKNDNLKEVFFNIKDFGEQIFDNSDIRFHAKNGIPDNANPKLPPGFTRQIVLIFKEGIVNAEKHAGCKNVFFAIEVSSNFFEIILKDDGIGFDVKNISFYSGLKKMKIRGDKIKSKLFVHSVEKEGTQIVLEANLNNN